MNGILPSRTIALSDSDTLVWPARHAAASVSPLPAVASTELLRTIARVLDIRSVFSRVSEIVQQSVPHDALGLRFTDRAGKETLEARSTDDFPAQAWCPTPGEREYTIAKDLRRVRPASDDSERHLDALLAAGYRSALTVRAFAQSQLMRLGFFSRKPGAYTLDDVPLARLLAHLIAVSVAHEQLATAERDRAQARGRSERVAARVRELTEQGDALPTHHHIVGRSDAWQRVLSRALAVAQTDATVFLQGESGTGKEVVARLIHHASQRKDGPFVAINCAALPDRLFESDFFGHEPGPFTGAHLAKAGQVELAAPGVLFLDEVSEMSLLAQARLLRFLQDREFPRLGGTPTQKANLRMIAATSCDLRQAVDGGTFRQDLFYRLQVFEISVPPLRDRISDVPLLAERFLGEVSDALGIAPARLSGEAVNALLAHSWPGNIRELRNALESAAILSDGGIIEPCHLSLHVKAGRQELSHDLPTIERRTIEDVLRQTDWNKSRAARLLGLTRMQLYVRLQRYGIQRTTSA